MEYNTSGDIQARYTHGINIDEPLAAEINNSGTTYYYHQDGLGSITALSNATGNIVQTYTYSTFGNTTINGTIKQPYGFTAREYDSETNLYFYRARYYDPKVGRFVTKDPIGFRGGINFYAYVKNNPVNRKDPSGLMDCADKCNMLCGIGGVIGCTLVCLPVDPLVPAGVICNMECGILSILVCYEACKNQFCPPDPCKK